MTFTNYLKEQLTDFVEIYKKHFRQTFGVAITFTIFCFIIAAILLRFSNFDKSVITKQISLLSYFFRRYSRLDSYSIIDLTKTVFIFFVALFSLGLLRLTGDEAESKEISFKHIFRHIAIKDILSLTVILLVTSFLDFILFRIDIFLTSHIQNFNAELYFHNALFNLRIYSPLIIFTLTIRFLTKAEKLKLTFKRILFLYISLWLFNEFAYEVSVWVREHIFGLILMPFDDPKYYLFESFVGIPLIAFYFLGYYSTMTTSLRLTELDT